MRHLKRYSQLFESQQELTQEQKDWLDKCTKGTWRVNPETGLVDVKGGFNCCHQGLTDFKGVKFGHVSGNFWCFRNKLRSLEGAPQSVGGDFNCGYNGLKSIKGLPDGFSVDGDFSCSRNELKSLEGLPDGFKVGWNFICSRNELKSLEGLPDGFKVGMDFRCFDNELKSLEGLPDGFKVGMDFDCSYNELESLEGLPDGFSVRNFNCSGNELKSLEGLPDGFKVGGDFYCSSNELKSLKGLPDGFSVGGYFECRDNELESLEGLPDGFKVGGVFKCSDNEISRLVINRMVNRMGDKKISLEQAVAECWRDTRNIPQEDRVYLAKSAFNSTVIEDPEIVSSEDAIQIYIDGSLKFNSNEREEYKKKLSRRGDIDQEIIDGLDSMVRILNRHR